MDLLCVVSVVFGSFESEGFVFEDWGRLNKGIMLKHRLYTHTFFCSLRLWDIRVLNTGMYPYIGTERICPQI